MGKAGAQGRVDHEARDRQPLVHPVRDLPGPLPAGSDRKPGRKTGDTLSGLHPLFLLSGILSPGRDHGRQGMGAQNSEIVFTSKAKLLLDRIMGLTGD